MCWAPDPRHFLLHHPHSHHSHNHEPGPTTHTLEQRESSTSEHAEWPDSGGGPHTSLAEENVEHILLENESGRSTTSSNTTVGEEGGDDFPLPPTCSNLRVMGHTLVLARSSFQVVGLHPFTSYWFLLLPHYKGVLGVPSNMQSLQHHRMCLQGGQCSQGGGPLEWGRTHMPSPFTGDHCPHTLPTASSTGIR
ncbi:uncharacterized protein LOC123502511 [Portunus trituberculatus]|uniref:uncharacterized protein LOC123502511 n=1 Tax=Portunus trituberculatus TaxID=210409 RepID=UPI001E1D1857|nr:uncharacterized protein LOC123502511 [Portunus trituberculatus]